MFGHSWAGEGSSRPTERTQAPLGQRPDVTAAGHLIHTGDATKTGATMGGTRAYPSGSTAQSSQATGRTVVRKSYASKVKETLDEMAQLLDIPPEVRAELTDEDIVAMSIKFIKKMTPPDGVSQPRDPDTDIPLDTYLAVLDGFVLHLGRSGKVQYISQNVLEYLGFTAEEMAGKRILDFVHPTDRTEVENAIALGFIDNESNPSTSNTRLELFLRMKHKFQNQRYVSKNDGYIVIHCVGFVGTHKSIRGSELGSKSGRSPSLWFVGRPLKPSSVLKYHLNLAAFVIRTGLNLQPNFADNELLCLLGYSAWEFSSCTLYQHVHPCDAIDFRRSHQTVLQKGQSLSHYYRMLTKYGESVWIQSHFSLSCNDFSPLPNCIVSLNYVLGSERKSDRASIIKGSSSTTLGRMSNSMVANASQTVGLQNLRETVPVDSCEICEADCCYNVPSTVSLPSRRAPLKCDECESHIMPDPFSKSSCSDFQLNNAAQLQMRNIIGKPVASTHTTTKSIRNKCFCLNEEFIKYHEKSSIEYASPLQEPCTYRGSQPQAIVDSYKMYEDPTRYPETVRNPVVPGVTSGATTSQLSSIPRPPVNDFSSYSMASSTFKKQGNDLVETREKRNHGAHDINRCAYAIQERLFHKSPETIYNYMSQPPMNSLNETVRSGGLIERYDTRSSIASMPPNKEVIMEDSYHPLSEFGGATGWSCPTYSDKNLSQASGNNELHSASNTPNIDTSLARIGTEMEDGTNYGHFGPSATSESNTGHWSQFTGFPTGSSWDSTSVSPSCFPQPNSACINKDCISERTFDLPLVADNDKYVPNASDNDNFEPDTAVLDEVMRQLDDRLGVAWEIALQKFSDQQGGM